MSPIRRGDVRARHGASAKWWCRATLALASSACGAPMEIFSSASDSSASVTRLTWFMIVLSAIIYVVVMALMVVAMRRNRSRAPESVDLTERGTGWIIVGGAIMPAIVLGAVYVVSLTAMTRDGSARPALTIDVIGHQWWWEARYRFPSINDQFATANEIHIPVGMPVRLVLTTQDVIHSFWVPQLQGKMDLIPGVQNEIRLLARRAGTYRGQCAEFCGRQHAKMALEVVADDSATFREWARGQLADAASPTDSLAVEGERLFLSGPCVLCHTVRGTPAQKGIAPDLTHVGSRATIAAGTLPNTLGNLEAWIANAQSIKPGVNMPTITTYSGRQLRAVATYVSSLK